MVLERCSGRIGHHRFSDLPELLASDDLLVLNDSRVIPARLQGECLGRSGRVEALLAREVEPGLWDALVKPGKKARPGSRLIFQAGVLEADVLESPEGYPRRLRFHWHGEFHEVLERLGKPPLPPYIERRREVRAEDSQRYQTVYAAHPGSVAAPTAGLHFTPELLRRLHHCFVTLHVGWGTFRPIETDDVRRHRMQPEPFEVSSSAAEAIGRRKRSGGRVIAAGSTSTRVLEHLALQGGVVPGPGETSLYIYPGFRFRLLDGLITNFHLPRSTLLLLVSAFAGEELIRRCYREAIRLRYRFYSYGDAMLIL